ncbi:DUF2637 domain-containing protein [Streptacidiphilus melanogenes]|uniref:DUF2637 domain-containing protein n=1 Tax=Streptacidiphilus melanogenes TaxID=411235 RepID=UPI0006947D70|nr:DUF2637 domain-containing protein [Streptacidiphilus melanogenes]
MVYQPVADPLDPFTAQLAGLDASAGTWGAAEDILPGRWWNDALTAHHLQADPPGETPAADGSDDGGEVPASQRRKEVPQELSSSRARRRAALRAGRPPLVGTLFEAATALIAAVVCALGYLLSYGPLHHLAELRVSQSLAQPWPVVIYGPWLAACLSLLRAALDGRRALHSWCVVVVFSSVATVLCIADVPRTTIDTVIAGLPPVTAAVALHQLVRQLRLSRGQRRGGQRTRRHRGRRA